MEGRSAPTHQARSFGIGPLLAFADSKAGKSGRVSRENKTRKGKGRVVVPGDL